MAIRFVRPSEVIVQLRAFRASLGMTQSDFRIFGAGDFQKATESGKFLQDTSIPVALYVMVSNSSSSVLTLAGGGTEDITHTIDILLYHQLQDNRGQYSDEASVWFKEFIIRALFGFEAFDGANPLQFGGDTFNQTENASSYSRTFQVSQSLTIDPSDIECCGSADDLDDFTKLYNWNNAIAPDFDDVAKTELDITIEQD